MAPWSDAPSDRKQAPALIRESHYLQNVMPTGGSPYAGLKFTDSCGDDWHPFAAFDQEPRDLPRLGSAGDLFDPLSPVVVYQPYKAAATPPGFTEASRLIRIWKPISQNGPASVFYPALNAPDEPFGGLGLNLTHFGGYRVYGVDSRDPLHIIAPDVVTARIMESTDGGENWREMPELQDLVTDYNSVTHERRFLLRTDLLGRSMGKVFPVVTAISFSPQDPRMVLVGTSEGGIFVSTDRGAHWVRVPGSERATYVTSFFWHNANTVYVSTYGRGLWKMKNQIAAPFPQCDRCDIISINGSGSPRFDAGVLIFEGRALGVRTEKSQLREVFVTPGSSVVFTGDWKNPQNEIAITESDGRDASEPLSPPKDGWIVAGVVLMSDNTLTGIVAAESEMSLFPAETVKEVKGSTESPTKGKPYLRLTSSTFDATATAGAGEIVELSATDFTAGSYEILVDDVPMKGTVTPDGNGSFTAHITAPAAAGYHRVSVRAAGEETEIDASVFVVKYH
jgi:hypothetical protein